MNARTLIALSALLAGAAATAAGCSSRTEDEAPVPAQTSAPEDGGDGPATDSGPEPDAAASDAAPDTAPQGRCTGTLSCAARETCTSTPGCALQPSTCSGLVRHCSEHVDEAVCKAHLGCLWSATNQRCTGAVRPCATLDETECTSQNGCILTPGDCRGVPTVACAELTTATACASLRSCFWIAP